MQESNPGLLHCRQFLYQLSYEGSPGGLQLSYAAAVPGLPGARLGLTGNDNSVGSSSRDQGETRTSTQWQQGCGAQVWKWLFRSWREKEDNADATPDQTRQAQNTAPVRDVGSCFSGSVLQRTWLQGFKRAEVKLEEIAERQLICTSLDVQRQKWTYWFDMLTYLLSKTERLSRLQGTTASLCSAKPYVCNGWW